MSELELTEQLDQAIEAMLRDAAASPDLDSRVAVLARLAGDLRGLPSTEFRTRLQTELEQEAAISTAAKRVDATTNPVRKGFRTITPYLVVSDVHAEAEFLRRAFGVAGQIYGLGTQGGFHAEYNIGGSMIMVGGGGEGSQWKGTPLPGAIHLYVEDVDAVYDKAVQAGASSLMPPTDMPYGERGAAISDVGGNHWYLATAFGETDAPADVPNLMPFFNPRGAPRMIEFLKQAFAAEEIGIHQSPEGEVLHAKMKVGDSIIEMGEAHEQWQPRPMVFMMYVDDVDAWYERAMKAEGVVDKGAPKLQPHGARMGAIQDPFDNVWYIASQLQPGGESSEAERKVMGAPKMFRIALQVGDLEAAAAFYTQLLDDPGIPIPRGSRHYFDCGGMILALVDVAKGAGEQPQPTPDYIYFAVNNLEAVFERAKALNCLAQDRYHDQEAGQIVRRPWGETSFYVEDPWGNGLCFVDETTLFTGK